MNLKKVLMLVVGVFFIWTVKAQADMNQVKAYKEAFPDTKPRCIDCHTDAIPKKDDGKHDLNEYGKKVKAASETPTAETYQAVGKAESK